MGTLKIKTHHFRIKMSWTNTLIVFAYYHVIFGFISTVILIGEEVPEVQNWLPQHLLERWRSIKDWRTNDNELPIWWLILGVLILDTLNRQSKTSFDWVVSICTYRLVFSTFIWTTSCFLGYEFTLCHSFKFLNLLLEHRYQKNPCGNFDLTWITDTVNLVPTNIASASGFLPYYFRIFFYYYTLLMKAK